MKQKSGFHLLGSEEWKWSSKTKSGKNFEAS